MRVAVVMPLAEQRGGAEQMLMHLLQANRRGPNLAYHVLFFEHGPLEVAAANLGYSVAVIPAGRLRQVHRFLMTVKRIRDWFLQEQIQVSMAWMAKAQLYAGLAGRMAGVPATWRQHGISERHWVDDLATRIPTEKIFCCSKAAAHAQQQYRPARATHVIYPSIDLERFRQGNLPAPDLIRTRAGLPTDKLLVGMVARLQHWKGVHIFVEAATRITKQHPHVCFVVVGGEHFSEPDYLSSLQRQADQGGISDRITFAGHQKNVHEWVHSMDVVVHASVQPEPFGMVILEGMALGKPVIATKAGGPLEIITDGVNGMLIESNCPAALTSAIEGLIRSAADRIRLGEAARQHVRRFNTDRLSVEVAQGLAEVLA